MNYKETEDFKKDLKRLLKKFRSLEKDLDLVKLATIEPYHIGILQNGVLKKKDANAIFLIPNFCSDEVKICKIKKFACKYLKNRGVQSGIRIIYAYHPLINKVDFIEMYFKGESENEDKERIKKYLEYCRKHKYGQI